MMMRTVAVLSLAAGLAGASTAQVQAAEPWTVDPAHTVVGFEVDHLGYSDTIGRFHEFEAEFLFDPENPSASSLTATIDVVSIDTGHQQRDEHLRSADFFDAENYPTMTFTTTEIAMVDEDTAEVSGALTIRDVTQPLTLTVELNQLGPNPFTEDMTAGFSATGTLNRSDYGIDFGVPMIGDEITLRIESEAIHAN
jgi:polyisoprenoid-binding protein YceI